jgi:hypothetical protein
MNIASHSVYSGNWFDLDWLRMKIIQEFTAKDDHGIEYTLRVCQGEHDTCDKFVGRQTSLDRLKQLQTSDGRAVNWLGKGEYEIIDGPRSIIVRSDKPDAP